MNIEVVEESSAKDVALQETAIAITNEQIMLKAVESGNVEALDRLLAMRAREEDRQARLEFERRFAEMQKEFAPVQRKKKGDKAKYVPLEVLQRTFNPIISKHGFSYRWDEESVGDGVLRSVLYISGYGHTVTTKKELPLYVPDKGGSSGKSIMNVLQAEGVRSTYGRRYTFVDGFGITIEDEDTDGYMPTQRQSTEEAFVEMWTARVNKLSGIDDGYRADLTDRVNRAAEMQDRKMAEAVINEIKGIEDGK